MKNQLKGAAPAIVLALALYIAAFGFIAMGSGMAGAKDRSAPADCIGCALDAGYSLAVGQNGFYQLRDSEGGVDYNAFGQLEPFGRKVPAVVSGLQYVRNPDGSIFVDENGKQHLLRDASGTIVVCVTVFRPATKGGTFDVCGADYGSRVPGGFDIRQPADLVGF